MSVKYILFALLLALSTANTVLYATDAGVLFAEALSHQQQARHAQAIEIYERLIASGKISSQLHQNLAVAYAETQQIGKAVLHAERACRLEPRNEDAAANWRSLHARVKNAPAINASSGVWAFIGLLSPNGWCVAALAASLLLAVMIFLKVQMRRRYVGASASIALCLFMAWAYSQESPRAVLLQPEISLRAEAGLQAKETHKIYEGTSFDILQTEGEWWQVRLSDGSIGWLPQNTAERVTSDE